MDFRLLGPLEVWHDGTLVAVTAPMQRAVLASVATRVGTGVPVGTITADLWGDDPPRTAVTTVRNYVRRLRLLLPEPVLRSTPSGYRLDVRPDQVDLRRFAALVGQARRQGSVERFDAALALWRGDPLSNIGPVPARAVMAAPWEEARLEAVEEVTELRLRRGEHSGLVAALTELTARYPLREELCQQLMTALWRGGRAADALAAYRRTRDRLAGELGLEPGPGLRRLQAAILHGGADPTAGTAQPPAGRTRPAHRPGGLPAPPTPFLGRTQELGELGDRLIDAGGAPHCVVYGQGGCGKSALAARLGHELAGHFVDGVLYVDLRGSTPGAPLLPPEQVLVTLLRALGDARPAQPAELGPLVDAYRARLRGRRVLVVLDNAASAGQVRPALPDEPGCAALVTSRSALTGLGDLVHLDALRPGDAVALLGRILGAGKVLAEPEAAEELTRLCGRLPLALRLIATRAALRPHWPLAEWVRQLGDERSRLDLLRHDDVDVRASFLLGLEGLRAGGDPTGHAAAAVFPLLGLVDPPHLTVALVAALTGWPAERAEQALNGLLDAQMVYSPGPGRYVLFDLIALLAKEGAAELPGHRRRRVLSRAVDWYVAALRSCSRTATGAAREYGLDQHHPTDGMTTVAFGRYDDVRRWLDRELAVAVAVLTRAARDGVEGVAANVRHVLESTPFYLNSAMVWTERRALAALLSDLDPEAAAFADIQVAIVEGQLGNADAAQWQLDRARPALGDDLYTRLLFENTQGLVLTLSGDLAGALRWCSGVWAPAADAGLWNLAAVGLSNTADLHVRAGRAAEALPLLDLALQISRGLGHQVSIAIILNNQLQAYVALGRHLDVVRHGPGVMAQHDLLGDAHQRAEHLLTMARSLRAVGDHSAAAECTAGARRSLAVICDRERVGVDAVFDHLLRDLP